MENSQLGRRQFLQHSAVGLAGVGATGAAWGADSNASFDNSAAASVDVSTTVDVLVVGGGTAGTIAAIQAARAGATTLILERNSQLGGTMTTGGVAFPGLFDAWGKQIIAGIGWELVRETVELDGGSLPDFSRVPARHWHNQVLINPFLYALLAEEKCQKAGVRIAYYEFPDSLTSSAQGWEVDCVGFGTRRRVFCRQIIDCTGGAEVVGKLNLPRFREEETQPGSILFLLGQAHDPGRGRGAPLQQRGQQHYVHGADSSNSRTVTAANLSGRQAVLEIIRQENTRLMHLQPEVSFRESYRIHGETVITVDDYTSGRVFDDAVCYAFYPVDLHTRTGVRPEPLTSGTVATVPLSALIPKESRNLLVAGRCVSSDRLANSALRVQAPCMAMGQAAGAAAALAAQAGTTPREVPFPSLVELLEQHGAIVPRGERS